MSLAFLYTRKEHLAKRSQNIIDEIGGIEKLLDFYKINGSFLTIPNSGRYTNGQLCAYCQYLLSNEMNDSIVNLKEEINDYDLDKTKFIYEKEKKYLSVRVNNVLKKLEHQHDFHTNQDNQVEYFKKYFFENFDFITLQNLGQKSINELFTLKKKLVNRLTVESLYEEEIIKEKNGQENNVLSFILTQDEKDLFLVNNKFDYKKLLCLFLFSSPTIKTKYHELLKNNYFAEFPLSNKELSKNINYSAERLRQIEIIFKETLIINAITEIKELEYCDLNANLEFTSNNLLILQDFDHFSFRNFYLTPNKQLSKIVYDNIYTNYISIDKLLKPYFKSFEIPNIHLLILQKFIDKIQLIKLLEWADEQIYSFEIISFEYNLEILIQRYFSEHDVNIDKNDLKDLYVVFSKIKKDYIEVDNKVRKRVENKNNIETIINEVYFFLKEKNVAQSTNKILIHLKEKNLEIKKTDLLKFLNSRISTFSFLGMGNWNLTEWNRSNGQIRGNFMQLIQNLLQNSNEPLHISELYDYINSMKKVSIHSLSTNLKLAKKGTFKFFNCSFIGLTEKTYDNNWSKIPRFRAVHLNKSTLKKCANPIEIIRDLNMKYGYPEKHLQYILDFRDGKYT